MPLIYFFSLLPLPVLAVTAIVMYQRKQHLIYPIFWTYLIFQFVRESGEGIALQFSHKVFYYTYNYPVTIMKFKTFSNWILNMHLSYRFLVDNVMRAISRSSGKSCTA